MSSLLLCRTTLAWYKVIGMAEGITLDPNCASADQCGLILSTEKPPRRFHNFWPSAYNTWPQNQVSWPESEPRSNQICYHTFLKGHSRVFGWFGGRRTSLQIKWWWFLDNGQAIEQPSPRVPLQHQPVDRCRCLQRGNAGSDSETPGWKRDLSKHWRRRWNNGIADNPGVTPGGILHCYDAQ